VTLDVHVPLRSGPRDDRALRHLVPDGTDLPAAIPVDVFGAAMEVFLAGQRVDMQSLAADLGVSRSTLYRRVGHRDRLLGEILGYLTRLIVVSALRDAHDLVGRDRVLSAIRGFMLAVAGQSALRAFLAHEPEAALRLLTSKRGPVQPALVEITQRLLAQEVERGALAVHTDLRTLAYVIVRVGEGFLYADVIADNRPDLELAVELIGHLLPA
jgi:AcrR family transcriptional regulator